MKQYLESLIRQALAVLGIDPQAAEVRFDVPKIEAHGDFSTNIAMTLAKREKKNPRELAQAIINQMQNDPEIVSTEIAGGGFINFRFTPRYIAKQLSTVINAGKNFGRSTGGTGRSVNVEWVSANPTGPLHAGHGRQVCIGETISSLFEWTGWNVTREYYFNNAGNQMNNLGRSVYLRYLELLGETVELEEGLYMGEYIRDIAQEILNEFHDAKRNEEISFFRKRGEQFCFELIKDSLNHLHIHHDVFFNEDSLYHDGKIEEVVRALKEKNLAYEQEGAVWFRTSALGMEKDRVIVKSTGEPTYRLPDIAYHREKILRGYDLIVDIFGADHIATIPDVLAGVQALGYSTDHIKVVIHQMVSFVNQGAAVKMSKRSANVYSLNDLIDDVGADAVRYFFVMRSVHSHLEFDLKLAQEQSENNPVYYLQYAHARIASIIRFAESEGIDTRSEANLQLLKTKAETDLIKYLLEFPEIIQSSAAAFEPHRLCTYLHEAATKFHKFYHECRVVTEDRELTVARIALCVSAKHVLANGLAILGITAPEKM